MVKKRKERNRKSEKLTPDVFEALKEWIKNQPTKLDAAEMLSLSRGNLDRIEVLGSCRPDTAKRIRKVLGLITTK